MAALPRTQAGRRDDRLRMSARNGLLLGRAPQLSVPDRQPPRRPRPAALDRRPVLARRRRETATLDVLQQAIAGHAVIRAYNLEEHTTRDFLKKDGALFSTGVRINFLVSLMDQTALIGMLLLQVLVIGAGAWLAFQGSL